MKSFKSLLTFLLAGLFLLATCTTVLAAESWVTDPTTGCKIGWVSDDYTLVSASWSGPVVDGMAVDKGTLIVTIRGKDGKDTKSTADAEMKAGKLDGRVSIKWSGGESFEGFYKEGLREGKGLYKYSDGWTYDGDFKNGLQNGYGIGRDAKGNIVHDGEWKNGQPVTSLKADKVLGIPWGASDEQAKIIMKQRPQTEYYPSFMNGKEGNDRWLGFSGPYADIPDAEIFVHFYQDKMWQVRISWPLKEDQVLDRFNAMKQGLTARYGAPTVEQGKYLDSLALWDLGGGYAVNVQIRKNTIKYIVGTDPSLTHPFRVFIIYYNQTVADSMNGTAKPGGVSKDF